MEHTGGRHKGHPGSDVAICALTGLYHARHECHHAIYDAAKVNTDNPIIIFKGRGFSRTEGIYTRSIK